MAIITRWRMPPENSWGYERIRRSGSLMPTRSSRATARFTASRRDRWRWSLPTSASCSSTVR